jgi:hypothetical protein
MATSLRMQSQQLLTKSEVFKDKVPRERKALTIHPRRCRSDTFMQESYRKTSNRALRQVIYFVAVRRFGEAHPLKQVAARYIFRKQLSESVRGFWREHSPRV